MERLSFSTVPYQKKEVFKIEENHLKKIEELTNKINADLLELRKLQGRLNKPTAAYEMYELYQNDKLLFIGTRAYLAKRTGLSLSTINTHCKPGYFDDKKNENKTKIVKI